MNEIDDDNDNNIVKDVVYHLKAFIILNGFPFSSIEDEDLSSIYNLDSRANLVRTVEELVFNIRKKSNQFLKKLNLYHWLSMNGKID